MKFIPAIRLEDSNSIPALPFLFCNGKIVLSEEKTIPRLNSDHELLIQGIYLGRFNDEPCYTARLNETADLPNGYELAEIRPLHGQLPDELYALLGYASQILTWRENHQFCSRCGTKAEPSDTERAMVCPSCGLLNYPRISPSMIVAVTRGNELLMARGHHFTEELYSLVAGFMEPGESLEQCVAREVMEETGLKISNIRYHSSQPWPFPPLDHGWFYGRLCRRGIED